MAFVPLCDRITGGYCQRHNYRPRSNAGAIYEKSQQKPPVRIPFPGPGIKLVQIFTYCECPSTVALTTKKPTSIIPRNLSRSHLFLTTCFVRHYDFSQFASIFRVKSGNAGVYAANSIGGCIQSL